MIFITAVHDEATVERADVLRRGGRLGGSSCLPKLGSFLGLLVAFSKSDRTCFIGNRWSEKSSIFSARVQQGVILVGRTTNLHVLYAHYCTSLFAGGVCLVRIDAMTDSEMKHRAAAALASYQIGTVTLAVHYSDILHQNVNYLFVL